MIKHPSDADRHRSRSTNFEMEHRLDAAAVILKLLIGLVLGLASGSCPNPNQILSGLPAPVEIIPVMLERQNKPLFEQQRFGHLAVLHLVGRMVVADPLLRIFVQHHADVVATISQDDAGFIVGYDAAADFSGHLIVLPDVCAVVAHG